MLKTGYKVTLFDSNMDEVESWDYVKDFNPIQFEIAIKEYETAEIKRLEAQDKRVKYWAANPDKTYKQVEQDEKDGFIK